MPRTGRTNSIWTLLRAWGRDMTTRRCKRRSPSRSPLHSVAAHIEPLESRRLLTTITYHGGSLIANVAAQAVYLGSDWSNSAALQTEKGQLDQFVSSVVNSPYMDMLANAGYNVGR